MAYFNLSISDILELYYHIVLHLWLVALRWEVIEVADWWYWYCNLDFD